MARTPRRRLTDEELTARARTLVQAQASAREQVTTAAKAAARARARLMRGPDWKDFDAVTRYARDNARISAARQRQIASVTNAYQAQLLTLIDGTTAAPSRQANVEELRGVPLESVYGRVADYYRYLTDNPERSEPEATAQRLAEERAEDIAEMDIILAVRAQTFQFMNSKRKIQYYRRVIHPERNASGVSCGLCIAASDRVYSKKDLQPIHFRCKCETVPVTDPARDIGYRLNQDDLNALYAAAGSTASRKLKETRFSIRQHGELGPVLTYEGNRFRGIKQVRKDATSGKDLPA
jgi:hypothetical protein